MRTSLTETPVGRTPRRRLALIPALALAIGALAAQSAFAQSGGVGAPGETTTTTSTTTAPSGYSQVFPLPGAHYYGQGMGAARSGHSHQGQDIFAACGDPLVSVSRARVKFIGFQRAAGHYVVLRYKKLKQDYFYAHLAAPAPLVNRQVVLPGQFVGNVGESGNASGCHLHFELWAGKWYRGGRPVNPLPFLQNWDSYS